MTDPTIKIERDREPAPSNAGMPRWLLILAAVTVLFLAAATWQWVRGQRTQSALEETRRELTLTRLEATLAAATIESQRGSYELARQSASDFFAGLQEDIGTAPANARASLQAILAQRDEVITMLSRSDSQSASILARLHQQYRQAVGRSEQLRTIPAPATGTP